MKKNLFYLSVFVIVGLLFASCSEDVEFDEGLLIGKWQEVGKNMFYVYKASGDGYTWDADDDVSEAEADPFTWKLVKSELQQIHIMEMGGSVPKYYTVTQLTSTSLKYKDSAGKVFSFTKVK